MAMRLRKSKPATPEQISEAMRRNARAIIAARKQYVDQQNREAEERKEARRRSESDLEGS